MNHTVSCSPRVRDVAVRQILDWKLAVGRCADGTIGVEEFEDILSFLCFNEIRKLKVTAPTWCRSLWI